MTKVKIVHFTPDQNFLEKFVYPVALAQQNNYVDVELCSCLSKEEFNDGSRNEASERFVLPVSSICLKPKRSGYFRSLIGFIKYIKKSKPDIVVLHTTTLALLPLILLLVAFPRIKRVYFNHGVPYVGYSGALRHTLKFIESFNIKLADAVYTITEAMSQILKSLAPNREILVIGSGSACGIEFRYKDFDDLQVARKNAREKLGYAPEDKILLYVGRFVKRKGILDLLDAWSMISNKKNFHLILVGPTAMDLDGVFGSVNEGISALGYRRDPSIYYLVADALCVPSHHEGLGYTYLEAASFGCVPVSSDIPGPTDFVKHLVTGIVVERMNPYDISTKLDLLFEDKSVLSQLSASAFVEAKRYERKEIIPELVMSINNQSKT